MNKRLAVLVCLLGMVFVSMPAYANPKDKKITLTCGSIAPDTISAHATVTLCEAASATCGGQMSACPTVSCDSGGDASVTISCSAPFKVDAVSFTENYTDSDGSFGSAMGTRLLPNGGKAMVLSVQVSGKDTGDTAVLEIK
jgi:hypothetical protein